MAVTTTKTPTAKASAAAPKAQAPVAAAVKTFLLELALYQRYATEGRIFEAGTVYEFPEADALEKLQETEESGRPVWKIHKTPKVGEGEVAPKPKVVKVSAPAASVEGTAAVVEDKGIKRLEVGSEEELAELGLGSDKTDPADGAGSDAGAGGSDDAVTV